MPYDFDRPLMYREFCDCPTAEEREKLYRSYLSAASTHYTGYTRTRRMITVALTYAQAIDAIDFERMMVYED